MAKQKQTLILVVIFLLLYLPRFIQEYSVRKTIYRVKGVKLEIVVLRELSEGSKKNTFYSGRYAIQFKPEDQIQLGSHYRVIGTISKRESDLYNDHIPLNVQSIQLISDEIDSPFTRVHFLGKSYLWITRGKDFLESSLFRAFDPQHANIILGMVFGRRFSDPILQEKFVYTGLAHTMVASGANIAYIMSVFYAVIRLFFRGKMSVISTFICILIYAVIVGPEPSLLRAAMMACLVLMAKVIGRPVQAMRTLCLAVALLLIIDPFIIFSISFLLSVAATSGVIVAGGFENDQRTVDGSLMTRIFTLVRSETISSIFVFYFTLPIFLHIFERVTVISLLSNIVVLWLIPMIFLFGILFSISVFVLPFWVVQFFGLPLWLLSEIFLRLVDLIDKIPFGSFPISKPSPLFALIFIVLHYFGIYLFLGSKRKSALRI